MRSDAPSTAPGQDARAASAEGALAATSVTTMADNVAALGGDFKRKNRK